MEEDVAWQRFQHAIELPTSEFGLLKEVHSAIVAYKVPHGD